MNQRTALILLISVSLLLFIGIFLAWSEKKVRLCDQSLDALANCPAEFKAAIAQTIPIGESIPNTKKILEKNNFQCCYDFSPNQQNTLICFRDDDWMRSKTRYTASFSQQDGKVIAINTSVQKSAD